MPELILTANTPTKIPGAPGRKALVVYVESGTAAFGWGRNLDNASQRGIPLPAGQPMTFTDEENKAYSEPLELFSTTGATVLYEEKF